MPECVIQESKVTALSGMDPGHIRLSQLSAPAQGPAHFVHQLNHKLAERHRSLREGQTVPNMGMKEGQIAPNVDMRQAAPNMGMGRSGEFFMLAQQEQWTLQTTG